MIWLFTWVACSGDLVTTDTTFVGSVSDAAGKPVVDLLVNSMEAQARTGSDGRFDLRITPDNRIVHFTAQGTWYRQKVVPSHKGTSVAIAIPPTRPGRVACPDVDCALTLSWDLGSDLQAQINPGCAPGAPPVEFEAVPHGVPTATCMMGKGADRTEVPLTVREEAGVLTMARAVQSVRVTMAADTGHLPQDCRVQVGERFAPPVEPGVWAAEVPGPVTVVGWCGDVPAPPVRVDPAVSSEVVLTWAEHTPTLLLRLYAPWATELVIAAEAPDAGWLLRLAPNDRGTVVLPPLAPGPYRLMVRAADKELPLLGQPPVAPIPDGVQFAAPQDGTMVGTLAVVHPLPAGPLQVSVEP